MATIEIRDVLDNETGQTIFPRTHVNAVIGLKDTNFFEAVDDGNGGFSVKLKSEYQGLWAEGWIAAGGINSQGGGGGGGGGLIQTVYTWNDMQEMSNSPEDDTTSAFNAKTVYEIYKQLQTGGGGYLKDSSGGFFLTSSSEKILLKGEGHSLSSLSDVSIYNPSVNDLLVWSGYSWVNVPQSSVRPDMSGYVTLDAFNGAVANLQAEIDAITSFFEEDASHNITLKSPYQNLWVPGWLAAGGIGTGGGSGGGSTVVLSNVKDTGTALATITVDGTPYTIKNAIAWGTPDNTNHKVTVTVDGGTPMTLCLDGYSSGGGSTDLPTVWNSLTNTVQDAYANTKIDLAHIPNITASMISDWNNVYTLRTPVSTTAANGTLLGVDALSNASSSTAGSDNSRIAWDSDHNAWHIYGNLYADGWVAAGGIGSASSGYYLRQLSDIYHNTTNILRANGGNVQNGDILVYDSANTRWVAAANSGGGGGGTVTSITMNGASYTPTNGVINLGTVITSVDGYLAKTGGTMTGSIIMNGCDIYPQTNSSRFVGTSDHRWSNIYSVGGNFSGIVTVNGYNTIDLSTHDSSGDQLALFNYGARTVKSFNAYGTAFNLRVVDSSDNLANQLSVTSYGATLRSGFFPADGLTGLGLGSSSNRWGNLYCTNGNFSGTGTFTGGVSVGGALSVAGGLSLNGINTLEQNTTSHALLLNYGGQSTQAVQAYGTGYTFKVFNSSGTQVNVLSIQSDKITVGSTLMPNYVSGLNLGGSSSDQRWSTIYGENADLSGHISMGADSYIDIGNARIIYDSGAKALHIKNKTGVNDTIGLFADGQVSAGGVAAQSTVSFVTVDGDQEVDGDKTFNGSSAFYGTASFYDYTSILNDLYVSGEFTLSGKLNDLTIASQTVSSYKYVTLRADRLYLQDGSNDVLLGSGSGKVIVGSHPGSTAIGSNKFYVGGTAIATAWNTSSDSRLKDNISPIEGAIGLVMALKPSKWVWNVGDMKGKVGVGLIAQDVEAVAPWMVESGEYKSLNYQMLHAYELSAIQDHEMRIRELERHSI